MSPSERAVPNRMNVIRGCNFHDILRPNREKSEISSYY